MSDTAASGAASDPVELTLSRYFDAPVSLVFQAFTDPVLLSQWFAPLAFHVPLSTIDIELRADGHWNMDMVGNDDPAMVSPVASTLVEVVPDRLIVGYEITEGFPGMEDGTKISMSLEFIPEGDGTRLELRQGPFPERLRGMSAVGWGQSFFKLDALLDTPEEFRTPLV